MRMIVDAFKDTLELGLEKPKQVVVRFPLLSSWVPKTPIREWVGVGVMILLRMKRGIPPLLCGH
jgi:hypothetical protein